MDSLENGRGDSGKVTDLHVQRTFFDKNNAARSLVLGLLGFVFPAADEWHEPETGIAAFAEKSGAAVSKSCVDSYVHANSFHSVREILQSLDDGPYFEFIDERYWQILAALIEDLLHTPDGLRLIYEEGQEEEVRLSLDKNTKRQKYKLGTANIGKLGLELVVRKIQGFFLECSPEWQSQYFTLEYEKEAREVVKPEDIYFPFVRFKHLIRKAIIFEATRDWLAACENTDEFALELHTYLKDDGVFESASLTTLAKDRKARYIGGCITILNAVYSREFTRAKVELKNIGSSFPMDYMIICSELDFFIEWLSQASSYKRVSTPNPWNC